MAQAHTEKREVLIVGISGGSGSGKTTLARQLRQAVGESVCDILYQDSYYYDFSAQFDYDGGSVNFDHPDAIEFSLMSEHLRLLKQGEDVEVPVYDFKTHARCEETSLFQAKPVILVDGILILTHPEVRKCLDVSLYVDTAETVRFERRLERDVRERGRTPEGVRNQFYAQVKPMHDQFVEPMQKWADRVISGEQCFRPLVKEMTGREAPYLVDCF